MRIDIIGGGPAGSYSAYLLAKKGHSVNVFEKDQEIGKPVQCTGILSDYFTTLLDPKSEFVQNTVEKTRIYSPNGNFIDAPIKKNYVICRKKFDNHLANKAKEAGVSFHLSHSFLSFERKGKKLASKITHNNKIISSEADILIGADGPLSPVAKSAGLFKDRKFIIGTQIEAKMKHDNCVDFYPYLGCYAWIVPVSKDTVRIGVASYKNSVDIFKKFASEKLGRDYKKQEIENQSGVIPVFNPRARLQKDNVYLIGDAATLNKATSGGGINQALKASMILSDCIDKKKDYNGEWKKEMYLNLWMHLILHKMMQKFKEEDWNQLIRTFNEPKMKKILHDESRDRLVSMVSKIVINKPSLIRYMKYFSFTY
jgi:digeranylgeranylglycerophospholipid reductase